MKNLIGRVTDSVLRAAADEGGAMNEAGNGNLPAV